MSTQIGKKIKLRRIEKGLKQTKLAKAVGLCRAALCNYENNEERVLNMQIGTLIKISQVLEKPISFFLEDNISVEIPDEILEALGSTRELSSIINR